jgi:hypothetical protein
MKKNTLAMLTIAAAFAAAMFTIPIHAHGQADVNHSTEIRIDNFKFTPETITVPVTARSLGSIKTTCRTSLPRTTEHSNPKRWIRMTPTRSALRSQGLTNISAPFTPRWSAKS